MANINLALIAKAEKTLDTKVNYGEGGIMTRRQWLKMQNVKGAFVKEGIKDRIQFNRPKYNRMSNDGDQEEYMRKCNEKVKCYELHLPGQRSFWEISKTEYEYFLNIQLAEDINTEKMELSNKIAAGTATEQEIKEDEDKDLEFFAKYARD